MPQITHGWRPGDPSFLKALEHVLETDTGYVARCPFFGCERLLEVVRGRWGWIFQCPDHEHDEIVAYLDADARLDPHAETAAWRAMCLAPTIDVWVALLLGQHVPLSRLDRDAVRRFRLA